MKKLFLNLMSSALFIASLTFIACGTETPTAKDQVDVLLQQGVLTGNLKHDAALDASKTYKLAGTFVVESGATLNIPAGTTIKATEGFGSYILVAQGGKININGTAEKPVTMTSDDNNTKKESGYWGGLIINGNAKISGVSGITATGSCEMNAAYTYGGANDADNSGSITYLKIMYAGARSSSEVEHNGLTLDAVGSGTKIENVFILESADDGIEFFGGSVNVKNLLVVNPDDDMFDNTQGYSGTWENFYGIWGKGYTSTESDPRGIESDGNLDGKTPTDVHQTSFTVKNMTIDLKLDYNAATQATFMQDVIKIRRGATANISNALVKGSGAVQNLVDMNDSNGAGSVNSNISLTNLLTNKSTDKDFNPGKDSKGNIMTYPNVKTDAAANTGCDKSVFAWTGYTGF